MFKNTHRYNYPYEESKTQWQQIKSREDYLNWHLKFTPWFNKDIIQKMVDSEWDAREKRVEPADKNINNKEESNTKNL